MTPSVVILLTSLFCLSAQPQLSALQDEGIEWREYSFEQLGFALEAPAGWRAEGSDVGARWIGRAPDGSPCAVMVAVASLGDADARHAYEANREAIAAAGRALVVPRELKGALAFAAYEGPKVDGAQAHRWTLFAVGGGRIYSLTVLARYSAYADLGEVFARVIESFRLL